MYFLGDLNNYDCKSYVRLVHFCAILNFIFQVLLAVIRWMKHDMNNRRNSLWRLLSYVRLPFVSPGFVQSLCKSTDENDAMLLQLISDICTVRNITDSFMILHLEKRDILMVSFSYVEQFNVTDYHNLKCYVYTCCNEILQITALFIEYFM